MADDFIKPDARLALLQEQLTLTPWSKEIQDQIDKRQIEIMQEQGLKNVGFGYGGSFIPGAGEGVGKTILEPTTSPGIFTASKITSDTSRDQYGRQDLSIAETNDPAAKGMPNYNPNATGSKRVFFDDSGKQLSASAVASSSVGQGFAAAGWDIGFGPGMIAPGVKADTTERDARIASKERSQRVESPAQAEISPTPVTPSSFSTITPVATTLPPIPVKTAPIDTILFNDDSVPIEIMTDLIFENIGGQELINIARNDTVNGQTVIYQPIKNLTAIQQQYNPNNIISLQATSDKYFQNFSIKFDEKVPVEPTGPAGAHVYVDPETGELVVEAVNMLEDEQIELEVTASGTIYEADI
jgi:hypothetical protein